MLKNSWKKLFLIALLATGSHITPKNNTKQIIQECCNLDLLSACIRDLRSARFFSELACIHKLRSNDACAQRLSTNALCASTARIGSLCASTTQTAELCTRRTDTNTICSNDAHFQQMCANRAVINNLCVTNSFRLCNPFGAHVSLNTDTEYTLGTPIPFDTIIDDQGGNVQLAPTRFVVPETGYYIITARAVAINPTLVPQALVAALDINVNGQLRRRTMIPYWVLGNSQSIATTTLMQLNAGTQVTFAYRVFINNPLEGLVELQGQTILVGSSLRDFRSFFTIHYLSSRCKTLLCPCPIQQCIECQPCPPVECEICEPCTLDEHPCPTFCFNT